MRAKLLKFGKGVVINKKIYYGAYVNSGEDNQEEQNIVQILLDATEKPEQFLGKEIEIEKMDFLENKDKKTYDIICQGIKLAK